MSLTSFREFVTVVEAKLTGLTGPVAPTQNYTQADIDAYRSDGPCHAFHWNKRALQACGVGVAVSAVITVPWIFSESEAARLLCVCWLVWALKLATGLAARSRMRGAVLIVDRCGITDRRISSEPFYWQDVRSVDPIDLDRSRVVEVFLRNPRAATAARRPWVRFGGWLQHRVGLPCLTLSLLLVDASASDVVGAIAAFRPGAVPREMLAAVRRRGTCR